MTIEAPSHVECVRTPRQRHFVHRAVTGRTTNTLIDMDAMIKEDEVGKIVNAVPVKWSVGAETLTDRSKHGTRVPDLRVTCHARACRRNSCKRARLNGGVAIAAVNAKPGDMMLMAERNSLLTRLVHGREVRGTI